MLAELEELGMQLARASAAKALAELAEPDAPEEEEPEAAADPEAAEHQPEAAQAATPRRTAPRSPGTAPRKLTDAVTNFIRLAKAVCELIALESGLATGPATARRGLVPPALRNDPRRDPLLKAFRQVTENSTDKAALRYELTYQLDLELAADPEKILGLPEIFIPLCEAYKIEIDYSQLPDEIIGMDPIDYENDPYGPNAPLPKATSPP